MLETDVFKFNYLNFHISETHTQSFYCSSGICPVLPGWADTRKVKTRKVKPIWIYWSKGQWVAVASAGLYASLHLIPDNNANIPPLSYLQAGCPSCHPTNSVKALKELISQKLCGIFIEFCSVISVFKLLDVFVTLRCI